LTVYFDVLGTLLSTDERTLRPGAVALLDRLAKQGHEVVIWSTGGQSYAQAFARRFELSSWVTEYRSKRDLTARPDFCVDDHSGYLIGERGNHQIPAYHGSPEDTALDVVLEAISRAAGDKG
jgi:hypothetical protein